MTMEADASNRFDPRRQRDRSDDLNTIIEE
jgi:hypothetical protein